MKAKQVHMVNVTYAYLISKWWELLQNIKCFLNHFTSLFICFMLFGMLDMFVSRLN